MTWVGAALPPSPPVGHDHLALAGVVRAAGMDGVWMGDHSLMVKEQRSRYPYSKDGSFPGAPEVAWWDWVVTLAAIGAAVPDLRLGVAVTVPVLRDPIVLAKQIATLDRLSAGRVTVGVGAGWFEEEFAALGVRFAARGARLDSHLEVMREVWSGHPRAGRYGPYELLDGLVTLPTPVQDPLPMLVAGDGDRAMRRALDRGQGWLTVLDPARTTPEEASERISAFRTLAGRLGKTAVDVVVRVPVRSSAVESPALRDFFASLVCDGVDGFICDVAWRDPDRTRLVLDHVYEIV